MKTNIKNYTALPLMAVASLALASCNVEKTEEGSMPEVEVTGEAKLPKYDVDAPDVDVTTEKKEIEVPKIEVTPADQDAD